MTDIADRIETLIVRVNASNDKLDALAVKLAVVEELVKSPVAATVNLEPVISAIADVKAQLEPTPTSTPTVPDALAVSDPSEQPTA